MVTGIDFSDAMLPKAKQKAKKNVILKRMDAMDLQFKKNSFDSALLTFAIRVIPDPKRALQEVERVTKPRGRIVIYDSFGGTSFWDVFEKIGWGRSYVLEDLLAGTKLKIVKKKGNLVVLENRK